MKENNIEIQNNMTEDEGLSDTPTIKSSSLEEEERVSKNFVSRVSSIPIVQDGFSTAQNMVNKTSLGRFALSTANSITKYTIQGNHQYLQTYYENYILPHVEKADAFGCRSLDVIQNKFPVVNQPTSEIIKVVSTPHIVDGMKIKLDSSFKEHASQVLKKANQQFGNMVDNVEATIEHYFPTTTNDEQQQQQQDLKAAVDENREMNSAVRILSLLSHVSIRLSRHVSDQLKNSASYIPLIMITRDELARITETSALIQKTTSNIQLLQEALVQSITLYAQIAQRHLPTTVTDQLQSLQNITQERLQVLTQQVSHQLQQVVDFVKLQSNETPEWLKMQVHSFIQVTNKHIELVRTEFARKDVSSFEKTKNVVQALQNQVLPLLQHIQSQLNHYSDRVRQKANLKFPLEYLGLAHASTKLAST
ncbi:uncharacterized protein BX663DRAFT_512643 [Cokeromyces recurvatus]|uniref:uncharacterized protein n=1 Tax=Cokeromyces recurvatus TaxID=90255 RepID=UPI00221E4AA6|nr:uncharacterized protein BX663DRAFT_512643 [Cokeromyces recurvatus]KAI7901859.1 hypothetical protein BX663DRAFT_512643 [Cokeromyces recurvatus]